jgi:hypothetical protein
MTCRRPAFHLMVVLLAILAATGVFGRSTPRP